MRPSEREDIMAIIITLDEYDMKEEFRKVDRDYFSLEACRQFIEMSEECGDMEFDPIAYCCDFSEESPEDIVENYKNLDDIAECRDEDGDIDVSKLLDALNYYTWAVQTEGDYILYQDF